MPIPRVYPALLAACIASALTVLAWWLPNRPEAALAGWPDQKLNAVSFAPFRPGQSPLTGRFPTEAEVEADLALLAPHVRAVRTYAAIEGEYDVAALAARHGLKLWLGIWLGQDRAQNAREIARGIATARRWPETVARVIVGNEVLLRGDLPPEELAADLDQVRAAVPEPVTYADVWEFWLRNPGLAAHVDQVTVHLLPYWEDDPTGIDGAVAHVRAVYRQVRAAFPGRPVVIGETGWPSAGRWRRDAAPGRGNQFSFVSRFLAAAAADGFEYNLIEAFDQDWKAANEGTVGARWGLWTDDRRPKFQPGAAVTEDPAWPWRAAAAIGLGLLLHAAAGLQPSSLRARRSNPGASDARRNTGSPRRQAAARDDDDPGLDAAGVTSGRPDWRLVALALALGNALVFAWSGTVPIAFGPALAGAAAVNLTAQAALAWLLMGAARGRLAGEIRPPGPTAAQATTQLRALVLHRALPPAAARLDLLCFAFTWTAAVLQLLLAIDPRYRDFPLPTFAVPLVGIIARAALRDLPRGGGGREEAVLAAVLILGAAASAVREGPLNRQSLIWNLCAVVLASPSCLRLVPAARPSPRALPLPRPR